MATKETTKKSTTTAAKKTTAKKTTSTAKKTTTTKKTTTAKKSSSTELKLSAAEKKLIQNYRKCDDVEKQLLSAAAEKAASGLDLSGLSGNLGNIVKMIGK